MNLIVLFYGIAAATFAFSGLYFFKFWRAGRDSFFLCFAVACWLLALERVAASLVNGALDTVRTPLSDAASWVYVIELLAFLAILAAVILKNRASKQK